MKKSYDIKRIIKEKNLIPKAVCLLLAIALWVYVTKDVTKDVAKEKKTDPVINYSETEIIELPIAMKNKKIDLNYTLESDKVKIKIIKVDDEDIAANSLSAYIDCDEINIDEEEFVSKSKITVVGFVHVIADSLKIESRILSSTPAAVEIVVTKE